VIKKIKEEFPKFFVAGNLNSNNVKKIIDVFSPWGVDVASGVESSPGIKNFYLMKDFIEKTRCV
jgi:phosphoribosylanthranilate isomerase